MNSITLYPLIGFALVLFLALKAILSTIPNNWRRGNSTDRPMYSDEERGGDE